jgi:thiamine-monophosphate kinase
VSARTGEDDLLRRLRGRLGPSSPIGDDAAILSPSGPLAVTVDSQIAGVHFVPDLDPARVARRLLAVNLSDLAAMGADPAWAFLALSAPPDFDHDRFFRAFTEACRRHGVTLAGGDLARCDRLVSTLTLIGTKPDGRRWLHRNGARPGHDLWLGGTVGESAAGRILIDRGARPAKGSSILLPPDIPPSLRAAARRAVRRHLLPDPQLELGRWLGDQKEGAAMDVSDGVARDLHRLCRESGTGAEIAEIAALPFPDRWIDLAEAISADPFDLAISGGEDYVLLFTLPPGAQPPNAFGCRKIGTITERTTITAVRGGRRYRLPASGWDHLKT